MRYTRILQVIGIERGGGSGRSESIDCWVSLTLESK